MGKKGKISVLMGIYNCEATLPEAIDSILAQTYKNWELILCDDCSADGTYAIAESYRDRYPDKIQLLKNDRNRRLAYSLNRCLAVATGEFVARMDGDDRSLPERFEKQVAFLQEHRDIVLVGTAVSRFDDNGIVGASLIRTAYPDRFTPYHHMISFNHATVLAYKWVFDALGGYTVLSRTERGQDLDLWFRFFKAGYQGANMSEVLYLVREDKAAFERRTPHVRWITFQTMLYGYRLLEYPWYWYWKPAAELLKIFVPAGWIRRYRARRFAGQNKQ